MTDFHIPDKARHEMERMLAKHYGEPVMPVSRYCKAFEDWAKCIEERVEEVGDDSFRDKNFERIAEVLPVLRIAIRKSNLLARLIYSGQKLRTKKCPVHKGRWSGYKIGPVDEERTAKAKAEGKPIEYHLPACECQDGWDLTGWLPE